MDGFSIDSYRRLLGAGRNAGYRFITFNEIAHDPGAERLCLMRHDVDVNVQFAAAMANVEAEEGIRSTYFLMLRSPAYNLLSRAAARSVREIAALGHEIGVHFDAQHPLVDEDNLIPLVLEEARIVGDVAGTEVHAVSFHQPSRPILERDIEVPGLINTYNRRQLEGWHYASDSNRDWRGRSAFDLLAAGEHSRIQVLVHPMWWVCEAAGTEDVWEIAVRANFETMQQQFVETEGAYGPVRSFEIRR